MVVPFTLPANTPRLNFDYVLGGYVRNHVVSEYVFESGKIAVPIMGKPDYPATADTTESVQVCSPFGFKVVSWDVARVGIKPRVPSPVSTDTNLEFLGGSLRVIAPVILNDLVAYLYQVQGVYYYRLKRPVWTAEGFVLGSVTTDRTPGGANVLEGKQFFPIDATAIQEGQAQFGLMPRAH